MSWEFNGGDHGECWVEERAGENVKGGGGDELGV